SVLEGSERLAGSFRPAGGTGRHWDVEVAIEGDGNLFGQSRRVRVELHELGAPPEGQRVLMIDRDEGGAWPLTDGTVEVTLTASRPVRLLRVVVGTGEYVGTHGPEVPASPAVTGLEGNYPNPFRSS